MKIYIFKLYFKGVVHFGETGIDLENVSERVTSDTFFSAIVNVKKTYYANKSASDFVEKFINNPPFFISSLFVFHENKYFLPRPIDDEFLSEELKGKLGKDLKKYRWLDILYFIKWLKGEIEEKDFEKIRENNKFYKTAFEKFIRPRVTLDRISQQSSIYHCGYIQFKRNSGLYGLVAFKDEDYVLEFKTLLKLLSETGIGGEKTYGCGTFNFEFEEIKEEFKELFDLPIDKYVLLSLYHPNQEEVSNFEDNLIAYDILRKKGWIASGRESLPLKRKSVGFLTEGSVFKFPFKGCLVDVTPESVPLDNLSHKVYRYGYAFTVPFKEIEE